MRNKGLFFDIGASDSTGGAFGGLQKNLSDAERRVNAFGKQFAVALGAATALFAGLGAAAREGATQIDAAAKAGRRLGESVGGMRALELAASEAGVSVSTVTDNIQTLTREVERRSTGAKRAIDAMGMSFDDLAGMTGGQQLEAIADRIQEMGLTAAQASVLLQDLGVRNREMVLLLMQGGNVLRNARRDVEDYGLALSAVDASRIEAANDAIGRLGLITQYVGQRLAVELVPAMGRLAQVMTDSLREGGLLRGVIDGLVGNLDRLAVFVGVTVTAFGVRYVGALAAARIGTLSLAGALTTLRAALIRLPFVLLIVGATELILWFGRMVTAAGGFGEALRLMGAVAAEVWDRLGKGLEALRRMFLSAAEGFKSAFVGAFAEIVGGFARMTQSIANGWNGLMRSIGQEGMATAEGIGAELAESMRLTAEVSGQASRLQREAAGVFSAAATAPLESIQALRDVMNGVKTETDGAAESVNKLNDALKPLDPGGAGGGSSVPKLGEEMEKTKTISQQLGEGFAGAFSGAISQAQSLADFADKLRQSMQRLLQSIAETLFNRAITQVLDNFFPSLNLGGAAVAGARANGGPVRAGAPYLVGERGPEIVVPSQSGTVVANNRMGGGGTVVQIVNNTGQPVRQERSRGPDGREIVRTIVGEEIGRGAFTPQLSGVYGVTPRQVRR